MAKEEKDTEQAPAGGGKKKLILIIVGAILLVVVSVGVTLMFVLGGDEAAEGEEEVAVEQRDPTYVDLKPAFTVNLAPDDPVGFLQISMQVLTHDDDVAAEIEKHKPLIRNNLVALFGAQSSDTLRTQEGKEALQKAALDTVQKVINDHGGGGEVDNVFFTSFVMQ